MSNKETPPSEEEIITYKLITSDDDDAILNNNVIVEKRAEGYEEIEVKKSSEVDKSKQIRLNEDTLFEFDCIVEDEYLCLKLNEIDALSPYIYIKKIELKELQKDVHKMFKALDTLEDVKQHIDKLFKNGKIKLSREIYSLHLIFRYKLIMLEIIMIKVIIVCIIQTAIFITPAEF